MTSPRRRIFPLVALLLSLLAWVAILAYASSVVLEMDPRMALAISMTPVASSLILVLLLASEWKELNARSPEGKARIDWEVIPLDRWRPPELGPRTGRKQVVVVPRRHIRRVIQPSLFHSRRRSLGLPADPPFGLNRRRCAGWYRRLTAW